VDLDRDIIFDGAEILHCFPGVKQLTQTLKSLFYRSSKSIRRGCLEPEPPVNTTRLAEILATDPTPKEEEYFNNTIRRTFVEHFSSVLLKDFTSFFRKGEALDFDHDGFLTRFPEDQRAFVQVFLFQFRAISLK